MQINPVLLSQLIISGIVGVVIRHGLEAAFASEVERPFKQFPANMVGCFFVGLLYRFVGPAGAASVSFVASITSFGAWNQALFDTALENGGWLISLFSLLAGLELAYMSFKVGLDVGEMLIPSGFKWKLSLGTQSSCASFPILVFSSCLWLLVTFLATSTGKRRTLWLASAAAPPGVFLRYFLSKFNRESTPLGTWLANLLASALTAAGAMLTFFLFRDTDPATGLAVAAFQKGFVDSIGTISAVVAEAHILHTSKGKAWRAYLYVLSTMVTCLATVAIISIALRGPCCSTSTSTAII